MAGMSTAAAGVPAEDVSRGFTTVSVATEPDLSDGGDDGGGAGTGEEGEGGGDGTEPGDGTDGEGDPGKGTVPGKGTEVDPRDADGNCSYSGTSFDTLEVPAGATYILTDFTVSNLIVGPGATVIGVNLVVGGSVTIDGAAHVGFDAVWIQGSLKIYNGGSVDICNSPDDRRPGPPLQHPGADRLRQHGRRRRKAVLAHRRRLNQELWRPQPVARRTTRGAPRTLRGAPP